MYFSDDNICHDSPEKQYHGHYKTRMSRVNILVFLYKRLSLRAVYYYRELFSQNIDGFTTREGI